MTGFLTSLFASRFSSRRAFACLSAALLAVFLFYAPLALADTQVKPGTCTNTGTFDTPNGDLITTIVVNIQQVLGSMASAMFNNIIYGSSGFYNAASGLLTLYIAIYGIFFTFGMTTNTLYDFAIRMIKIGIIALLISGPAWSFFYDNVVVFFNEGTDQIINVVIAIAVGGDPTGTSPFASLDAVITQIVSAKMAVTLLAIFFTGPFGWVFFLITLMAIGSFFRSLMFALWVYLMSLVLKTLLFGLAPIFLSFLLFNRTKYLFDGWLNQIVNASLQPIFLFAFFGFFVTLIGSCIGNLLARPVCWTQWSEGLRGTAFEEWFWRFTDQVGNAKDVDWNFYGNLSGNEVFPIDLMTVLIFLMLAELSGRFNDIVVNIAKELAGAATNMSMGSETFGEMLRPSQRDQTRRAMMGRRRPAKADVRRKPGVGGRAGGARGPGAKPNRDWAMNLEGQGMTPAEKARQQAGEGLIT